MDSDSDSVKKKVERWSPASNGRGAYLDVAVLVRVFGASSDCGCEIVQLGSSKGTRRGSYEVVRPDIDPSDQIFLRDILPIEKVVKVDRRRAG